MFINFLSYKSIFSKIKIKKTCQFFETEVIFLYRAVDYVCSVIILCLELYLHFIFGFYHEIVTTVKDFHLSYIF